MAYTRIHAIKTTLNKALDYIENPAKTQEQILVTGYNVDPLSASLEFRMTAALAREIKGDYTNTGGADNLAYHMIQSFSPYDDLTPEQAHDLGKKWADEILQGKYEYVITTHVDKGHIHNHIIFNSVSFYDYKKFETKPYKTAAQLRKVSDRLCEEQGLSVIKNPNLSQKSPSHYEWEQRKGGTSWKAQIKKIIDDVIAVSSDYDSFKEGLQRANVEVKEGKRISFRIAGSGQERFCRGDRIGENYSREKILERLSIPKDNPAFEKKENHSDVMPSKPEPYDKMVEAAAQKSRLAATKELAAALVTIRRENIRQESDFDSKIDEIQGKISDVKAMMTRLSDKNQEYKNAAKYLLAFRQYLQIKKELEKQLPFKKAKFQALHESELAAFEYAVKQLERLGVNTNVDPDKVMNLVKDQDSKISELSSNLKDISTRLDQIRQARQVVKEVQKEAEDMRHSKNKEKEER